MSGHINTQMMKNSRAAVFMIFLLILHAVLICFMLPATADEGPQVVFSYTSSDDEIFLDIWNQTDKPVFSGSVHMTVTRDSETIDEDDLDLYATQNVWVLPGSRFCAIIKYSISSVDQVSFSYDGENNPKYYDSTSIFAEESEARIQKEGKALTNVLIEFVNPSMNYAVWPKLVIVLYDNQDHPLYAEETRLSENDEICPPFGRLWVQWDPYSSRRLSLYSIQDQVSYARTFSYWDSSGTYDYRLLENGTAEITRMTSGMRNITIPPVIDGYLVSSIASYAFENNDSIRNIAVSEGIQSIGNCAFQDCEYLENLYLPSTLDSIGTNPVRSCRSLKAIAFHHENSRYAVINNVLVDQQEQQLISYPLGRQEEQYQIAPEIRSIGDHAFDYSNLSQIILSENLTAIGKNSFSNCDSLSATVIKGSYAEQYCTEKQIPISETIIPDDYVQATEEPFPDWLLEDSTSSAEEAEPAQSGESDSQPTEEPFPDWLLEDDTL